MNQSKANQEAYKKMVEKASPNSHIVTDCIKAFFVGGTICTIGQLLHDLYKNYAPSNDVASAYTTVTLIFIGALLTGLGLYEKIGKFAGAGSVVPITGFANSVAAPAIEFKKEGFILGVGAKMFIVAGPVIVYGTITSIIMGLYYYFTK